MSTIRSGLNGWTYYMCCISRLNVHFASMFLGTHDKSQDKWKEKKKMYIYVYMPKHTKLNPKFIVRNTQYNSRTKYDKIQ